MRRILTLLVALLLTGALVAQQYQFTKVVDNPHTKAKHQGRTGTCWCFATLSLLESELIRMGKEPWTCPLCILYAASIKQGILIII